MKQFLEFPLFGSAPLRIPKKVKMLECQRTNFDIAAEFNKNFHSVLPKTIKSNFKRNSICICFSLTYENHIFGVGMWTNPIAKNRFKDSNQILELRRLCLIDISPKNSASRFIKLMICQIKHEYKHIKRLISYQDSEQHLGTIYKAANWEPFDCGNFQKWNTKKRIRNKSQSNSRKIRWEFLLE